MHIPALSPEPVAASRLLQQLREVSNEVVPETNASVAVSLSPDARLASLVERLIAGEGQSFDARQVVRLLGESALFSANQVADSEGSAAVPLPTLSITDPSTGEALSLQDIGRSGFDADRLLELLQSSPEALTLVQASITSANLDTLFASAANDTRSVPPTIRLYIDNGGVPGVQLEPPQQPEVSPLNPLP